LKALSIQDIEIMLNLGETFPNFTAESTCGTIDVYEYLSDNWGLILSHPKDFTPVCTTEVGRLSQLTKEFEKRNVKVLLISCDSVDDHSEWLKDVTHYSGCKVPFPVVGDADGQISNKIGMLDLVSSSYLITIFFIIFI